MAEQVSKGETSHAENCSGRGAMDHYSGDHVTAVRARSSVERSLVVKAGFLFSALSALVYFAAYLVSFAVALPIEHANVAQGSQQYWERTSSWYAEES